MPFDFKAYDAKCNGMTPEELQREWQHYTRLISGASTSTAVSGLAIPLTMGVSVIGVGMAAPAIHNARKKREIIEKHLQKHGTTHNTRKRDVLGSMAFSGTIGVVTLGVGTMGAEAIAANGAEHGISAIVQNETAIKVVTHAAMDGAGMGIEHLHTSHVKKKEAHKAFKAAGVFQAVQNAKAAEAGYPVQPYQPYAYGPGSSSQPQTYAYGPGNTAPPYTYGPGGTTQPQLHATYPDQTWVQPPPSYSASTHPPAGFVADSKAPVPVVSGQAPQSYQYPTGTTAPQQQPAYQYGPAQPQYQINQQTTMSYPSASGTPQDRGIQPTAAIPDQQPVYAAYGTVPGYPQQVQTQTAEQGVTSTYQAAQASQVPAQSTSVGPGNAYSSAYDMTSMAESLPAQPSAQPAKELDANPPSQDKALETGAPVSNNIQEPIKPQEDHLAQSAPSIPADPSKPVMRSTFTFESFEYYEPQPAVIPENPQHQQPSPQSVDQQSNKSPSSTQPQASENQHSQGSQPPPPAPPQQSQNHASQCTTPPHSSYYPETSGLPQHQTGSSSYSTQSSSSTTSYSTASYTHTGSCPTPLSTYSYAATPISPTVSVCSTPYQPYQTYRPQDYASTPNNNMPPPSGAPVGAPTTTAGYNPSYAAPQYHYGPAPTASQANNATYQAVQGPAQNQAQPQPQPQTTYHAPVQAAPQQQQHQSYSPLPPQQPGQQQYSYQPQQYQAQAPAQSTPQPYGQAAPTVSQPYSYPTNWGGNSSYVQ